MVEFHGTLSPMAANPWQVWTPPKVTPESTTPQQDFFGRTPQAAAVLNPVSLPKVPGADQGLYDAFQRVNALGTNQQADLSAYRTAVAGSQPQTAGWAAQEQADISNLFSPNGYEAMFGGIRNARANAFSNLTSSILGDTRRALNLGATGRGATGLGSYLLRGAQAQAGKLRANEAVDASTQARADLAALLAGRTAAQGRRTALQDATLSRTLNPAQAESTALGQWLGNQGTSLQQALANLTQAFGLNYG